MINNINRVTVLGTISNDPQIKYLPSGQAVAELRVETQEAWKNKDGTQGARKEWHKLKVWGAAAEDCKSLSVGDLVFAEGRLQTSSWEDKQKQKRYTTEIIVSAVIKVGSHATHSDHLNMGQEHSVMRSESEFGMDDLPF